MAPRKPNYTLAGTVVEEHKSSCTNADNRRNKKTQKDITTEQGCLQLASFGCA